MSKFVIIGSVGTNKYYYCGRSNPDLYWSGDQKDADMYCTQSEAKQVLKSITSKDDPIDSPALSGLASLDQSFSEGDKINVNIKLALCVIGTLPIIVERWHVEDGEGKTKRLS